MKIPNSPFPRGLGCSGRRAWARKPENKAKWIAYVKAYKENLKEAKQYKWVDRAQCNKLKGIYSCHMIVPQKHVNQYEIKKCFSGEQSSDDKKKDDSAEDKKKKEEEAEKKKKEAAEKKAAEEKKKQEMAKKKKKNSSEEEKKEREQRKKDAEEDDYEKYADDDGKDGDDDKDGSKLQYKSGMVPDPVKPQL